MEDQLIIAAKEKDKSAFTALYHKYKRYWFTISLRYNSSSHDAQDCLQNALVKIFSKINSFDQSKGSFKTWSSRIVINESITYLKTKQNSLTDQLDIIEGSMYYVEEENNRMSKKNIINLIQKLPIGYRQVFNLYVMEGYSHNEIAEILGISTGTSKSQLFKARRMLQTMVGVALEN
jgi:RNA polymerase sigma-70 factor (ECF subfamily)